MTRSPISPSSASPLPASHLMQRSSTPCRRLPLRPSAAGAFWLLAVFALIATAVNYGNNLIFVLAFLLLAVWLQAGWSCYRHLAGITWHANQVDPVFAGEALWLDGRLVGGQPAASITLTAGQQEGAEAIVDTSGESLARLAIPTLHRGEQAVSDLTLRSCWPLDLWQASRPLPALRGMVYPQPAGDLPLPTGNPHTAHRQAATDDFQGLRAYAPGDSPRRINWRVFGRCDELAVNRFDGGTGGEAVWLAWDQATNDGETRLAQLTAWVLAADQAGREYGLHLPGQTLPPGRGRSQRHRCLTQLALFNLNSATTSAS